MKKLIGTLLIIYGISLGLYVGGYLLFWDALSQIVVAINSSSLTVWGVVWNLIKMSSVAIVGTIVAAALVMPGEWFLEN